MRHVNLLLINYEKLFFKKYDLIEIFWGYKSEHFVINGIFKVKFIDDDFNHFFEFFILKDLLTVCFNLNATFLYLNLNAFSKPQNIINI